MDAEFLRYLCGTHHVSEAFKRAGVRDGDQAGFVIFLPSAIPDDEQTDCHAAEYDIQAVEGQANGLLSQLHLEQMPMQYSLSKLGATRIGMKFEDDNEELTENSLVGHILSSEFTS